MTSTLFGWIGTTVGAIAAIAFAYYRLYMLPHRLKDEELDRLERSRLEAETRANDREDGPVRQRIHAAAGTLATSLRRSLYGGQFSLPEWQHWHNELLALVESDAGARALGTGYLAAKAVLNNEPVEHQHRGRRKPGFG